MFAVKKGEIESPRGWIAVFVQLCIDIDLLLGDNKHGFHWEQVKEKYGSARYYWDMEDNFDLQQKIAVLVNLASNKSRECCMVCGSPGKLDTTKPWVLTLCEPHTLKHQANDMASRFFSANEV